MKISSLEAIFSALNAARVRYLVAGGVAVNIHGYQRMTADLDLVIQLEPNNIKKALTALNDLGYQPLIPVKADDFADPGKRKAWIEKKHMQVLSLQSQAHPETTVDIFVNEPFDFEREFRTAAIADIGNDISFGIVSIATLIQMKDGTGRPKDADDIENLIIISEESDDNQN